MGPTWVSVYRQGLGWVQGMPQFDWSIPSVWMGARGKSEMLKLLARVPYKEHGQSTETWKVFWRTRLPPFLRDFVFAALWRKLKVGERLMKGTHEPQCPICHVLETVDDALYGCRFHSLVLDVIDNRWAPIVQGNQLHTARSLPAALSLATPLGIVVWCARAVH